MTSLTDTVFGLYVCQKSIYQPENQHARCPDTVLQYVIRFSKILIILDFNKSKKPVLRGQKITFWKIRDDNFKELYIARFCAFNLHFTFKFLFLVIFQTSIFDQELHGIGPLKSV